MRTCSVSIYSRIHKYCFCNSWDSKNCIISLIPNCPLLVSGIIKGGRERNCKNVLRLWGFFSLYVFLLKVKSAYHCIYTFCYHGLCLTYDVLVVWKSLVEGCQNFLLSLNEHKKDFVYVPRLIREAEIPVWLMIPPNSSSEQKLSVRAPCWPFHLLL